MAKTLIKTKVISISEKIKKEYQHLIHKPQKKQKTMKKIIKNNLIRLPRRFRIYFGRIFINMLGTMGTHEFTDDIILYNELRTWIDSNGKPTTPFLKP